MYPLPATCSRFPWIAYRQSAINNLLEPKPTSKPRRRNLNVLLTNGTFLIFAVLVVWCRPCLVAVIHCFKLLSFLDLYLLFYYNVLTVLTLSLV